MDRGTQFIALRSQIVPEAWEVIWKLLEQIRALRKDGPFGDGKLEHFRAAVVMAKFPYVVALIENETEQALFSTIRDIEEVEEAIRNYDPVPLQRQCFIIFGFFDCIAFLDGTFQAEDRWLFDPCRSLKEVIHLRQQLVHLKSTCYLRVALQFSYCNALKRLFPDPDNPPQWQDLLLIYEESFPHCLQRLDHYLYRRLRVGSEGITAAAATLLLSYITDRVIAVSWLRHTSATTTEEKMFMIKELLRLGATLMISHQHHYIFLDRLEEEGIRLRRVVSENRKEGPCLPTALYKILSHQQWSPDFLKLLVEHTCCSLDAVDELKSSYIKVKKVVKLQCLALQNLKRSDLEYLPPKLRMIASRHLPFPVHGPLR